MKTKRINKTVKLLRQPVPSSENKKKNIKNCYYLKYKEKNKNITT